MIVLTALKDKVRIVISNSSKILYNGYFVLVSSFKVLIDEIDLYKNGKKCVISDKDLLKVLCNDSVVLTGSNKLLEDFLCEENISYRFEDICESCLEHDKINILSEEKYYLTDRVYCKDCSMNYLDFMIDRYAYSDFNRRRYKLLLNKYDNLNDILNIISNDYNPTSNDLTLFDTVDVTEGDYEKVGVNSLDIPEEFRKLLAERIDYLLPVQLLAVEHGLLDDENLLVVSTTASGKSLVGELAGISSVFDGKKMIYLSPLVALAYQKYMNFREDYESLGLNVVLKVGYNRVHADDELDVVEESLEDADIIVATYEGLDYVLRSGESDVLNNLGVVVIDEVHMLSNEDRGHRLNGLVNRLSALFPFAQLIALSATIRNAESVADAFGMKLVSYDKRPVLLERYLVPLYSCQKKNFIAEICKKEFNNVSENGYRGQTIIFTDSRRNTQIISSYLKKSGVNASYFHAGLTYKRKMEIQESFLNQDISVIVTTAALSSGVDFPASCVIFESLRMGFDWITSNDFHQMLGRAGRPSYHNVGRVYMLPVLESDEEYDICIELLESGVDEVNVLYDTDDVYEQVLSDICAFGRADVSGLRDVYDNLWLPITFNEALDELISKKLVSYDGNMLVATKYGVSVSKSFIKVELAEYIRNHLNEDIVDICLEISTISNVYLSNSLIKNLKDFGCRATSLYAANVRNTLYEGKILSKIPNNVHNRIVNIVNDFLVCDCNDIPFCDCMDKRISEHIINRRLQGWSPAKISNEFSREYDIIIYSGDVYSYLDDVIRSLDSIKRIAETFDKQDVKDECVNLIKKIEDG